MLYEQAAMAEPKVFESTLGVQNNHDGTYTIVATKKFTRKNDQIITMNFTKRGLAAFTGWLKMITEDK